MILVTRPDPGGSELARILEENGFSAMRMPTIEFAPPPDIRAMQTGIEKLGEQDWIVFMSPHAVIAAVPAMRRVWPVMPSNVRFAAVGAGTAQALKEAGYDAVFPRADWSTEGLLAMPEFNDVAGKHIAIIRGMGGRELLEPALTERQAIVNSVITYERKMPAMNGAGLSSELEKVEVIVCTSVTSIVNLEKMAEIARWRRVKETPVVVISERIKKTAEELNFQKIWVATNAGHQAIIEMIKGINYVR